MNKFYLIIPVLFSANTFSEQNSISSDEFRKNILPNLSKECFIPSVKKKELIPSDENIYKTFPDSLKYTCKNEENLTIKQGYDGNLFFFYKSDKFEDRQIFSYKARIEWHRKSEIPELTFYDNYNNINDVFNSDIKKGFRITNKSGGK